MTRQQKLHQQALRKIEELKWIVGDLKDAGDCKIDGDNALLNVRFHLKNLGDA